MEAFVLDACSLIAFLNDEEGAEKVEDLLRKAKEEKVKLYMNKLNILEIYYGVYYDDGEEVANEILSKILELPIIIVDNLSDAVLRESGRLKAGYSISLADSIAIGEAKVRNAQLVTADHHEFDPLQEKERQSFIGLGELTEGRGPRLPGRPMLLSVGGTSSH